MTARHLGLAGGSNREDARGSVDKHASAAVRETILAVKIYGRPRGRQRMG